MELAGLEPATSWVRSRRSPRAHLAWLSASSACGAAPPTPSPTICSAFPVRQQACDANRCALGTPWARRDHVHVLELPRGTVTLLFTDIEGSTRLLHELGDRYGEALAEHRRLLRAVFARHGGV